MKLENCRLWTGEATYWEGIPMVPAGKTTLSKDTRIDEDRRIKRCYSTSGVVFIFYHASTGFTTIELTGP